VKMEISDGAIMQYGDSRREIRVWAARRLMRESLGTVDVVSYG